jgi:predicted ferric reductase
MIQLLKFLIPTVFLIIFLIPGFVFFRANPDFFSMLTATPLNDPAIYLTAFKLFGLYAFVFLWAQIIVGPFTKPLSRLYGPAKVLRWHRSQGIFTFLLATLHPILFHFGMFLVTGNAFGFFSDLETYFNSPTFLWVAHFGPFAWMLMILTIATAILRDHPLIWKHWHKIHMLNYIVFILAFLHSFNFGSDTQLEPLKSLYYFFGATFLISVSYRIVYRRILSPYVFVSLSDGQRSQ